MTVIVVLILCIFNKLPVLRSRTLKHATKHMLELNNAFQMKIMDQVVW